MATLWLCVGRIWWTLAGWLTSLVRRLLPGLVLLTEPNKCSYLNLNIGQHRKAKLQLILASLSEAASPWNWQHALSTKDVARGGQAALELRWLLPLSSLFLQCWWCEYKSFYCCGSDSPEVVLRKLSLAWIFVSLTFLPFLLSKAFLLKPSTRGVFHHCHIAAWCAAGVRQIKAPLAKFLNTSSPSVSPLAKGFFRIILIADLAGPQE